MREQSVRSSVRCSQQQPIQLYKWFEHNDVNSHSVASGWSVKV